jgi:hypothetical protein
MLARRLNNLASKQHQSHQILISQDKLEMRVYAMARDFLQHAQHHIEITAGSIPWPCQVPLQVTRPESPWQYKY